MKSLLPNPEFLGWLIGAIAKAKREIVIVNYLATLRDGDSKGPVAQLVNVLVAALKRGVTVRVVLEGSKFSENFNFYHVLKDAGADVWMDTSLTFIHEKAVLIDGKVLAIGSHNLTDSALSAHEELAIVTGDLDSISAFKNEFERITAQRRAIKDAPRDGILLPTSVVDVLTKIKRSGMKIPYLIYLILCREDGGSPRSLSCDPSWIVELHLQEGTASNARRLREALELLDARLNLVKYDAKKDRVTRLPLTACAASSARGRRTKQRPPSSGILLTDAFWRHGWHARLSVEAMHLYFAGEAERLTSPFTPWWRKRRDEIAAQWGLQKQLVNRAQRELMRMGLMEVLFEQGSSVHQRYVRYSNLFRQNPFYDYDARVCELASIAAKAGPAVFKQASEIASIACRDCDAEGMAALCEMIEHAGAAKAGRVLRTMKALAANSTLRKLEYAIELLKADERNRAKA